MLLDVVPAEETKMNLFSGGNMSAEISQTAEQVTKLHLPEPTAAAAHYEGDD